MTMTYSWEKSYSKWDTEPDFFDEVLNELEEENAKVAGELSIEDIALDEEELALDESEFDLE